MDINPQFRTVMNFMKDLNEVALPASEAVIKFRKDGKICLSEKASALLKLKSPESFVRIKRDEDGKIYIGQCRDNGYRFHKKRNQFIFYSVEVARSLSEALNGFGNYRIEEESRVMVYPNDEYYVIFWKNYEK